MPAHKANGLESRLISCNCLKETYSHYNTSASSLNSAFCTEDLLNSVWTVLRNVWIYDVNDACLQNFAFIVCLNLCDEQCSAAVVDVECYKTLSCDWLHPLAYICLKDEHLSCWYFSTLIFHQRMKIAVMELDHGSSLDSIINVFQSFDKFKCVAGWHVLLDRREVFVEKWLFTIEIIPGIGEWPVGRKSAPGRRWHSWFAAALIVSTGLSEWLLPDGFLSRPFIS